MLGDISNVESIFIVCGYTDMRKSIDGLMTLVKQTYDMNPFDNKLFLFCGRRGDTLKALHWESDGFVLMYKRLENGRFQWPRKAAEVRDITWQEFRWLMEGLSINQPKALKSVTSRDI
jgi:transposase